MKINIYAVWHLVVMSIIGCVFTGLCMIGADWWVKVIDLVLILLTGFIIYMVAKQSYRAVK